MCADQTADQSGKNEVLSINENVERAEIGRKMSFIISYPGILRTAKYDVQPNFLRKTASAPGILLPKYRVTAFTQEDKSVNPRPYEETDFLSHRDAQVIFLPENINIKHNVMKILEKKIPKYIPKGHPNKLYAELMYEVLRFCYHNEFTAQKASVVTGCYALTHHYFTNSYWRESDDVFHYFKELLLRNAVQHPPKSLELLDYPDCHMALCHFHRIYIRMIPVIRALAMPNFRLRLPWKNVPVEPVPEKKEKKEKKGKKGKKGKKKKKKK